MILKRVFEKFKSCFTNYFLFVFKHMTFILYKIVIYIIDNEKLEKEIFVQTIYKKKIYKNLIKEYNVYQTSLFKYFIL